MNNVPSEIKSQCDDLLEWHQARCDALVEDKQYEDMYCLLYTSPSPRDRTRSRMPSSA